MVPGVEGREGPGLDVAGEGLDLGGVEVLGRDLEDADGLLGHGRPVGVALLDGGLALVDEALEAQLEACGAGLEAVGELGGEAVRTLVAAQGGVGVEGAKQEAGGDGAKAEGGAAVVAQRGEALGALLGLGVEGAQHLEGEAGAAGEEQLEGAFEQAGGEGGAHEGLVGGVGDVGDGGAGGEEVLPGARIVL